MLAGVKSSIAFQAALQLRNGVVQAYMGIMTMQVESEPVGLGDHSAMAPVDGAAQMPAAREVGANSGNR